MNQRLQKLLHIDDARILRSGRMSGYGCVIFGLLSIVGSPVFHFLAKSLGNMNADLGRSYTSALLETVESGSKAHQIALDMDQKIPHFLGRTGDFGIRFSFLVGALGLSLIFIGLFYFRLLDAISEQISDGNAEKPLGIERQS